ncbi:MAG: ATP-binding protein [Anaerolineae bacterium]|jgi:hypothetical protein|nr:ATP-binding protein [Anaerolineae bacterium]MBT4311633.1 ATP-binding protein [Anaerolineae bacterium]MBT4457711.1 ATP-binding protein [Anaerolineae bacterium]MBT6061990.1 ATP-binding protein [Anaerolineae bacterium]MBT6324317.1 ATP-binding protein [Anaerolineae bacterium]
MKNQSIGYLVGGGLKESFNVRLTLPSQEVQEGAFTVIRSGDWQYYGIVTDIQLGATDPRFADEQTEMRFPPKLAEALHGQTLYTNLEVLPTLMLEVGPDPDSDAYPAWVQGIDSGARETPRPRPVKNVPPHHAQVTLASAGDIDEIFGKDEDGNFEIGTTREQGHPVRINLDTFVQRSSGVFGATGTGKSFLTRIVLAGLIDHSAASVLVLDMHNEYGFDDTATDTGKTVAGLKTLFQNKVQIMGLGAGTNIRGANPDFHLEIAMGDIQPADVLMLTRTLNLRETTPTVLSALQRTFKKNWFKAFSQMLNGAMIEIEDENGRIKKVPAPESIAFWANENGINVMAAEALHSKLGRLFNAPYIAEKPAADSVKQMIDNLDNGKHVILSFGKYDSDLDYLLVSNLLTRKISSVWEKRVNDFRTHGKDEPRHLILVVEEAHKLLNREMASQTTFATIAREMRKYYVTLMIVDQRPSQIYDEVMSQLGTRISGWLGDDDDIRAVLSGLSGREALRGMLARLQPKEEVILLGWGVPMPLPVKSRRYDDDFVRELRGKKGKRDPLREMGF